MRNPLRFLSGLKNRLIKNFLKLLMLMIAFLFATEAISQQTFTVTNASNDENTAGSLRWCIRQAYNAGAPPAGTSHTINFNITTAPPHIININGVTHNLWQDNSIVIDATTQPGYNGSPIVVIRSNGGGTGFELNGTRTTIRGLAFQNMEHGIRIQNQRNDNIVQGNYFGLAINGNDIANNRLTGVGVFIGGGSAQNIIGGNGTNQRNVIANCQTHGILIEGAGTNNEIVNNYIGVNFDGTQARPNGTQVQNHAGIRVQEGASLRIRNNLISGNNGLGIRITGNSANSIIAGNKIGTNAAGMAPIPNLSGGIRIQGSNGHIIGGTTEGDRNIISGNGGATHAVQGPDNTYDRNNQCGIYFVNVNNAQIMGNYIGTDVTGNSTGVNNNMGNLYSGIKMESEGAGTCSNNIVGGDDASFRNVIGGNGFWDPEFRSHGVLFKEANCSNNKVTANYIGLGADGISNIGNAQDGVSFLGAIGNIIGGTSNEQRNIIVNNTWGVFLQSNFWPEDYPSQSSGNTIIGNYIGVLPDGTPAGNGVGDNQGGGIGIQHGSSENIIGGTEEGERNIVSANYDGIVFRHEFGINPPSENHILNNYIGVDISGNAALPNLENGILIAGGATNNLIGGTVPNIISANGKNGISIENGVDNRIFNNYIGVGADESTQLGNGEDGIRVSADEDSGEGSIGNRLGGTDDNQGNIIAYNGANGIAILDETSFNNSIHRNRIFCNALRGIELNGVGNENFASGHGNGGVVEMSYNQSREVILTGPAGSYIEVYEPGECLQCTDDLLEDEDGKRRLQGKRFITSGFGEINLGNIDEKNIVVTVSENNTTDAYNTSEFSYCTKICSKPEAVVGIEISHPDICADYEGQITLSSSDEERIDEEIVWYAGDPANGGVLLGTGLILEIDAPIESTVFYAGWASMCDTSDFTSIEFEVKPLPEVSITPNGDIEICEGGSVELIVTGDDGTLEWFFKGEALTEVNERTYTASDSGRYHVMLTNEEGCVNSDTANVIILPTEFAEISLPNGEFFCEGGELLLEADPAEGISYSWYHDDVEIGGETGNSLLATEPGVYRVVIVMEGGCTDEGDTEIFMNENPQEFVLASDPDSEFCEGDSATLSITSNEGNLIYRWFRNDVDLQHSEDELVVSEAGSYSAVIEYESTGCSTASNNEVEVIVHAIPDITLVPDGDYTACEGSTLDIIAEGEGTIEWFRNEESISVPENIYPETESASFRVVVTSEAGCTNEATTDVSFERFSFINVELPDGSEFCEGSGVNLVAAADPSDGITYTWYRGDTNLNSEESEYFANEGGTYRVEAVNADGCFDDDEAIITMNSNPLPYELTVDPDAEFCEGESAVIKINSEEDGLLYSWTRNNQDFESSEIEIEVTQAGSYSAVIEYESTGCSTASTNEVEVIVHAIPEITLVPDGDFTACEGSTLDIVAEGEGTLEWFRNEVPISVSGNTYPETESASFRVVVTSAAGCTNEATTDVSFERFNFINIDLPDGSEFCEGSGVNLIAVADPSDGISYTWYKDDADLNIDVNEYLANEGGTYKVEAVNADGCFDDDDAIITMNPNPLPFELTVDPDAEFCDGESAVIKIDSEQEGLQYSWTRDNEDFDGAEIEIEVSQAGSYRAVVTDVKECQTASDNEIEIVVRPNPAVGVIAGPASVCENTEDIEFEVENAEDGVTYNWTAETADITSGQDSPLVVIDFPNGVGTVNLSVSATNQYGCSASEPGNFVVNVDGRPEPIEIAGADPVCSSTEHTYSVEPVSDGTTYTWNLPSGASFSGRDSGPSVSVEFGEDAESGIITVIATNETGCSSKEEAEKAVTVNLRPSGGNISGDNPVCGYTEGVQYTFDGPSTSSYGWSVPEGSQIVSGNGSNSIVVDFGINSGFINVLETNEHNCVALEPVRFSITVNNPAEAILSGPSTVCYGSTVTYRMSPAPSGSTFDWTIDDSETDVEYTINGSRLEVSFNPMIDRTTQESMIIEVIERTSNDCSTPQPQSISVTINPQPEIYVDKDSTHACSNEPVEISVHVEDGTGSGNYSYRWGANSMFNVTTTGLSDTTIYNPEAAILSDRKYFIWVTDELGGCAAFDSVYIDMVSPEIIMPNYLHLCNHSERELPVMVLGASEELGFEWQPYNTTSPIGYIHEPDDSIPNFIAEDPGRFTYELTVTDYTYNCSMSDTIQVYVTELPVVTLRSSVDTVCAGVRADLIAEARGEHEPAFRYYWFMNEDQRLFDDPSLHNIVPVEPTQKYTKYTVVAVDTMGCSAFDTTGIVAINEQELVVPNLFTPNNDNLNDTYVIKDAYGFNMFEGARMEIYNRWGKLVYQTEDYDNSWDGDDLSDGVYYYNLVPSCGQKSYKGWVHLMR